MTTIKIEPMDNGWVVTVGRNKKVFTDREDNLKLRKKIKKQILNMLMEID